MYAVEGNEYNVRTIGSVMKEAEIYSCDNICITGGEPLLQIEQVVSITERFIDLKKNIILETCEVHVNTRMGKKFLSNICFLGMRC